MQLLMMLSAALSCNQSHRGLVLMQQTKLDGKAPSRQMNVMDASVASGCEEVSRQHCFTVQSSEAGPRGAVFELQAESPADQQEWMTTIHVSVQPSASCTRHLLHLS